LDGKKKWNKGAPLSKKSTGVGRGKNGGKKDATSAENEPPLQTVPLPAERDAVNNECVRDFLVDPAGADESATPAMVQQPQPPQPPLQQLPQPLLVPQAEQMPAAAGAPMLPVPVHIAPGFS